ncbi:MAG: zinc-dependent metalloprotease [Cytophagales bacterium]|nr:zinc-dependent metalloprotease [Cytophagales bacterium]
MKNLLIIIILSFSQILIAQDKEKKKKKSIKDLTKSSQKIDGLFPIFQDSASGELKMLVTEDQLNKDFIYFSQIADGVTEAGSFRGAYGSDVIFHIQKYYNKIEFVAPNTNFYFDADNPLSRSQEANTSHAVISSNKILAEKDGKFLIDVNSLFLSETLSRVKPPKRPGASPNRFSLGSFDKGKSKVREINNYPENTNLKTEYVYKNPNVLNGGSEAVTDARYVSIQVFHSMMNMPEEGYEIRHDDPRVGYFLNFVNDMTETGTTNYRDMINRWRLVKKNPDQEVSEPVKPITWWIENSTPHEWRETIKDGVLAWNEAFERAGFKNAMEVKVQPDDADWDAGDIRYNVLRWTSSPNPPFGGYGPSMTNPRTGEIIGADIMLEFVHFTNRVFYNKLVGDASQNMDLENESNFSAFSGHGDKFYCSMGHLMHENLLFGRTFLEMMDASDYDLDRIEKEGLKSLIMHEVGHTIGLNHNMKASQLFSPAQLYDADFIEGKALTGSVMDYAGINLTMDKASQGQYYDMAVGPYDIWAVEFGYKPFESDSEREEILSRSTDPELIFGNDADDMRSPGKAIDPRVMTGDLSNDQITYSVDRFKLVNKMMGEIVSKFSVKGNTYEDLRRAYYTLNSQAARAGDVISRFIGGVYVDRSTIGQEGGQNPYTPVSYADQKRAMNALNTYVFAPNAYKAPNGIYNLLAKQRRGFEFFSGPEDPKIHDQVLSYQTRVLAHIMHPNTLQRIIDSELYGNQYSLSQFMGDLNNAMFKVDISSDVNSFRQNLQAVYVTRLIDMINGKSSGKFKIPAKSMAIYNLEEISKWLKKPAGNTSSIAHRNHIRHLITNALSNI